MKLPETSSEKTNRVTREIIAWIKSMGGWAQRVNVKGIRGRKSTNPGMPDIDIMYRGIGWKCEIKRDDKDKLNDNQIKFGEEYSAAGGTVMVATSLEDFIDQFHAYVSKRKQIMIELANIPCVNTQTTDPPN